MNYKQLGYKWEKEVGNGLDKIDGWYFKIPDTRIQQFKAGNKKAKTPKVPADFIWFGPEGTILLEAKSTSKKRFPLRNIKPHQVEIGVIIERKTIAKYYFLMYLKYHKKCYLVNAIDIAEVIDPNMPNKSLTIEFFRECGIEVKRYTARYNNDGNEAFVDLQILPILL